MTHSNTDRHAEYKIPGGKLLVIDFSLQQGRLHNVRLSGDFFLEPPETLDALDAALESMPADASDAEILQALEPVAAGAQMYGITLAGIVEVLRRALA